jgi:glycosyltransferase involved in cell wall biosynthesis
LDALVTAVMRDPEAAGFDVVQIEGLEMAPHGLAVHRRLSAEAARAFIPAPRLIYDAHNAEWLLQDRAWRADLRRIARWPGAIYSMIQTLKLRRYERALLAAADGTVAVSEADAAALRPLAPTATIAVVPNGVDVEHYAPADRSREAEDLCVFTGKMDFRPNVDAMTWFCREAWPLVRAGRPGARLEIVGRDPAPAVTALHDPDRGIEVVGAVPDVRPHIERATVVVVPLRVGGGTRLKVLEAMAMGKAIAATSMAVEGLEVRDGHELRLADGAEPLARSIAILLDEPSARAALGDAARALAVARYRWSALVPEIERLYG